MNRADGIGSENGIIGVWASVVLAWGLLLLSPGTVAAAPDFQKEIEPILFEYCYDCHGDGMDKGNVALDKYEEVKELLSDQPLWEGIYHNMEGLLMPPSDKAQPTDAEREKLIAWIESAVFKLDPKHPDPGRVTIRRLNREEYNNTVRDLVGLDLRPADDFPEDDTGYGFDNIGDVLTLSPALFERYVKASGIIMDRVIVTSPPPPQRITVEEKSFRGVDKKENGTGSLSSNGTVAANLKVSQAGKYRVEILAGGSPAKNEWPLMQVRIGKDITKEFRVETPRSKPKPYVMEVDLKAGDNPIQFTFPNDAYDPQAKDPQQRDRNLKVVNVSTYGPKNPTIPSPNASHKMLYEAAPDPKMPEPERARKIVKAFAYRAYRRPVKDEEVSRLLQFYEMARKEGGSFDAGVKLALQAVLVSPNFLYRGEVQPDPNNPKAVHEVDEFALASRLSYFLWSTMPDGELRKLAEKNELRKNLDAQITRMLADSKASELTKNFAGQWLQLRNLDLSFPDRQIYKGWDDRLKQDMRAETERYFEGIMRENRSILEFLDSDYTYLNERLAKHYGVDGVKGNEIRKVALTGKARQQRGGLITHGSILTITSNPTRTSAVNRGNWVLENFLASPPPPPPDNVEIPPLESSGKKMKDATLRQQLEKHREMPLCASCHKRMDPIGFGLENFDGVGAWRDMEAGQPIDASGELYTGESFQGPGELKKILLEEKRTAFTKALSEAMLTYALGRGLEFYDKPALHEISKQVEASDYHFHSLVKAVVDSVPFQMRRGDTSGQAMEEKSAAKKKES